MYAPRTLEYAGQIVTAFDNDPDSVDMTACLHGEIGQKHAPSLVAFIKTIASMPTYEEIKSKPTRAKMNPDMIEPISRMMVANAKWSDIPKVVRYIRRYPAELQAGLVTPLQKAIKHDDLSALADELGVVQGPKKKKSKK